MRYPEIALLLQGNRVGVTSSKDQSTVKQFAPGRALMTGGLMTSKTTSSSVIRTAETSEPFIYLRLHNAARTVALYGGSMQFGYLGAFVQLSTAANLNATLSHLSKHAPQARVDKRVALMWLCRRRIFRRRP